MRSLLDADPGRFFFNAIPLLKRLEDDPGSTKCLQMVSRAAHSLKTPQIILCGPFHADAFGPELLAEASRAASLLKVCFHAVTPATSSADSEIAALCRKTGGSYLRGSEDQLRPMLLDLTSGLIDSYRVRMDRAPGVLKLQILSERGCGSFVVP